MKNQEQAYDFKQQVSNNNPKTQQFSSASLKLLDN